MPWNRQPYTEPAPDFALARREIDRALDAFSDSWNPDTDTVALLARIDETLFDRSPYAAKVLKRTWGQLSSQTTAPNFLPRFRDLAHAYLDQSVNDYRIFELVS